MLTPYDVLHHQPGLDECVARVAAAQHGVFTRAQAIRCGATKSTIRWRLRVGRWVQPLPKVYRIAGVPVTWRQQASAACLQLGPGAVLSHRAASALRGTLGVRRGRVEVTVPRNRNRPRRDDVIVHLPREPIPPEDITAIDGIPVTKPARTLLDLATVEPVEVVERALDDALRLGLVSLAFLDRWLEIPLNVRHRGARTLQRLVDARKVVGVTESPLEMRVLKLLASATVPVPMLQYRVWDGDTLIARLDFAYPVERVAIEADGFRFHDGRTRFDDERARGNRLQSLGWNVLRITSAHVDEHPDEVVDWVRQALARRAR
jgi:hypothetical protein